jgi:hypothetical protein
MGNNQDDLDKILSDLKSQYQTANTAKNPEKLSGNSKETDDLLKEIKSKRKTNTASINDQSDRFLADNTQINHELDSIKVQYQKEQNWQKTQEELNYNRNQQDILIQEQQKQLQRKQLTRQAEKWLANLDPVSDEGMWFNQLAESYPSKLEAAIHYLSTLKQSSF